MVAISVLLGLTWAFGLLSVFDSSRFVFQVLFSVCNSLQGLFIFLLLVIRPVKVRRYMFDLITGKYESGAHSSTTFTSRIKSSYKVEKSIKQVKVEPAFDQTKAESSGEQVNVESSVEQVKVQSSVEQVEDESFSE